jgi:glycerol-3-phosphate dehydrogenase
MSDEKLPAREPAEFDVVIVGAGVGGAGVHVQTGGSTQGRQCARAENLGVLFPQYG